MICVFGQPYMRHAPRQPLIRTSAQNRQTQLLRHVQTAGAKRWEVFAPRPDALAPVWGVHGDGQWVRPGRCTGAACAQVSKHFELRVSADRGVDEYLCATG